MCFSMNDRDACMAAIELPLLRRTAVLQRVRACIGPLGPADGGQILARPPHRGAVSFRLVRFPAGALPRARSAAAPSWRAYMMYSTAPPRARALLLAHRAGGRAPGAARVTERTTER